MQRHDARLLLIDGRQSSRVPTHHALRRLGCRRVEEAASGASALAYLRSLPFDLVITAWRLPDTDGVGLLHEIRHTLGLIAMPVVVVTSLSGDVVARAAESGVSGFLAQPVGLEALESTLSLFVGGGLRPASIAWS